MPVSVSNTAYGIIGDAMHDAGLLGEGDDPNSEQLSVYLRRLCDIINLWQTQGLKLFLLEEITVVLVAGQNTYTVNPSVGSYPQKHLQVLQGRVETPQGLKRPLNSISWQEWNRLSSTGPATVVGYFVDKQPTSLIVKFWNTPDSAEALNTVILLVRTQADNPMNLESDVSFPQEWRIALRWGLADDICTGQPQAIMDRCAARAKLYREMLEDWDVEDTETTFAPNTQGEVRRFT
jgi:hypothetical protein